MKLLFSLFIALLSLSVMAQNLTTSRGPKGELILSGTSCKTLVKQRDALCEWKKNEDGALNPIQDSGVCKIVNGRSSLSILNCLPKFTQEYHQKKLANFGPNCWGTVLSFSQISMKPRFVWPEEIQYWLESPLCRKLEVGEKRRPGDVLNMFAPESLMESELVKDDGTKFWDALYPKRYLAPKNVGYTGYQRLLHSEIYLTSEMAFGKDSPIKEDRFNFHELIETYARPRDEVECMENQSIEPHFRQYANSPRDIRNSSCAYFSNVYRCSDAPGYFSEQSLSESDQKILDNIFKLQELQKKLFSLVINPSTVISPTQIEQILNTVSPILKNDLLELSKTGLEKNREMLLTWEYFTALGLKKSLAQARLIPAMD